MKLLIDLHSKRLIIPADKAAAIIEALAHGKLYDKRGWSDSTSAEYIEAKEDFRPDVRFVHDEQLLPPEAPIVQLSADLEASNKRWYEQYQAAEDAKKKVKELEEKVKEFTNLALTAKSSDISI